MNTFINFAIEANLVLISFLLLYYLILRKETSFGAIRFIMVAGMISSLTIPFIHISTQTGSSALPSLEATFTTVLPVINITDAGNDSTTINPTQISLAQIILLVYILGVVVGLVRLSLELLAIRRLVKAGNIKRYGSAQIVHLENSLPAFSFFNYIFLGQSDRESTNERQQILNHELVHASQWHSFDILLINLIRITWWFNPLLNIYKKIFVQLHEFEADARSVENHEVNRYCNLLARVALHSAGYRLVNQFGNSLTIKRIEMMRIVKSKIPKWKLVTTALFAACVVGVVSCQDQVTEYEASGIPKEAKERFETFKTNFAGETFLVEYDERANAMLLELDQKFGNAKHIELFTIEAEGKLRTFSMLQFDGEGKSRQPGEVHAVVDDTPQFVGGFAAMGEFIGNNLRYPSAARQQGIEGTSYIEFVVEQNGTVTNVKTLRGISPDCDAEAERVVKSFPAWIPGKKDGEIVRTKFIIPINYKLQ